MYNYNNAIVFFYVTVEVLIAFYENRLKDNYVVTPPVLHGLQELVSHSSIHQHQENSNKFDSSASVYAHIQMLIGHSHRFPVYIHKYFVI